MKILTPFIILILTIGSVHPADLIRTITRENRDLYIEPIAPGARAYLLPRFKPIPANKTLDLVAGVGATEIYRELTTPGPLGQMREVIGYKDYTASVTLAVSCKPEQVEREVAAAFGMTVEAYRLATRQTGPHQISALAPRKFSAQLIVGGKVLAKVSSPSGSRLTGETTWVMSTSDLTYAQYEMMRRGGFQIMTNSSYPLSTFQSLIADTSLAETSKVIIDAFTETVQRSSSSGLDIPFVSFGRTVYSKHVKTDVNITGSASSSESTFIVGRDLTNENLLKKLDQLLFDDITLTEFRNRHERLQALATAQGNNSLARASTAYVKAIESGNEADEIDAAKAIKAIAKKDIIGFLASGFRMRFGSDSSTETIKAVSKTTLTSTERRQLNNYLIETTILEFVQPLGPFKSRVMP